MRVLVVTDWPALAAGTERYVELLVDSLRAQGDDVRLMTTSVGSAADGKADYVAYGSDSRALQVGLQVVNPSAVRTLRRALREFRPDAVHLNMFLPYMSPAIMGLLRDVRTVLMVLDYKAVCPSGTKQRRDGTQCRSRAGAVCWRGGCLSLPRYLRDRERYRVFHAGLANVDRVVAISRGLQAELRQVGIAAETVDMPVPAPAAGFARRPAVAPTFVYGGRLAPVKGVDTLLRAFAHVRAVRLDARLRVFGDGPDRDDVTALTAALDLTDAVEFDHRMLPDWADLALGDAWALVAPSRYREPLGLVALEAVVRGVPVIATRGGFEESIADGTSGLIVDRGHEPLARAMLDVAGGRALPSRQVPAGLVAAARRRHDPAAHAHTMHDLLAGAPPALAA